MYRGAPLQDVQLIVMIIYMGPQVCPGKLFLQSVNLVFVICNLYSSESDLVICHRAARHNVANKSRKYWPAAVDESNHLGQADRVLRQCLIHSFSVVHKPLKQIEFPLTERHTSRPG